MVRCLALGLTAAVALHGMVPLSTSAVTVPLDTDDACTSPASRPECAHYCCENRTDSEGCTRREWSCFGKMEKSWCRGVVPWYNAVESLDTCPNDCAPCSPCLDRVRDDFKSLTRPAGCRCKRNDTSVDPCFVRNSCECFCVRHENAIRQCPDLANVRVVDEARQSGRPRSRTARQSAPVRASRRRLLVTA